MTFKYVVGQEFRRIPVDPVTAYRVDSIERDTTVSCMGNMLHTVYVTDVATGHKWYLYATDAEVE